MVNTLFKTSLICSCLIYSMVAIGNTDSNSETWKIDNEFFKKQVKQNMSPGRTVRSLISHYPESTTGIVNVALDLYPTDYKEIIHSAISTQPSSAEDIVTIALKKGITECESIVLAAIKAEPSYVSFVTTAAAHASPDDFNEILRVAVITEPDSADKIVQHMAASYPDKIVDILSNTVQYVPLVGEYIVDALLAVFPNKAEEVVSITVRESLAEREQIERIIVTAINAGVTVDDVSKFALMGGATNAEVIAGVNAAPANTNKTLSTADDDLFY